MNQLKVSECFHKQNSCIIHKDCGLPDIGFRSTRGKKVEGDTQSGGSVERTIVYEAPFTKCDREADYERAWGVFEGRPSS